MLEDKELEFYLRKPRPEKAINAPSFYLSSGTGGVYCYKKRISGFGVKGNQILNLCSKVSGKKTHTKQSWLYLQLFYNFKIV